MPFAVGRHHQTAAAGLQKPALQRVVDAGLHDVEGCAAIGGDLVDRGPSRLGQRGAESAAALARDPAGGRDDADDVTLVGAQLAHEGVELVFAIRSPNALAR